MAVDVTVNTYCIRIFYTVLDNHFWLVRIVSFCMPYLIKCGFCPLLYLVFKPFSKFSILLPNNCCFYILVEY